MRIFGAVFGTVLAGALTLAGAAGAGPVSSPDAREQLFGQEMILHPADLSMFSDKLRAHYKKVTSGMAARTFLAQAKLSGIGYYGAIAVPLTSEPSLETLTIGGNAHSPGAAAAVVTGQCEKAAGEKCQVVAYLLPAGYAKRGLTLSMAATAAFGKSFSDNVVPRYLAYSPATAAFAVVKGKGADRVAIDTCNKDTGGRRDCVIAIADE
ncbi:MAG: hypothetical protein CR993_00030 [Rhodobacterales bacterium]|nr:MAG: hypothetical protein CR993_00030 [Rhodobacterales bacterium]